MRLARFARVKLLRHALPISLLILRKKATVLQSKKGAKDVEIFQNGSVHEFCRLKVLITLKQVITSGGREKEQSLNEQNFDGEANWSGVVNFHCTPRSFVMSMRFIFGHD